MRKGKYTSRGAASKSMALVLSLILLVGCVVGGTIAWLTDSTQEVKNTFTDSDVDVELEETLPEGKKAKMVPGHTIGKNPKAWVAEGSEACYLFVKVVKSDNFDTYMTYEIADGWTELAGESGVYYRICDEAEEMGENAKYSILKDDQVKVKGEVTKAMMDELTESTYPTLSFTAYGCQLMESNDAQFDAAEAWEKINPSTPTT